MDKEELKENKENSTLSKDKINDQTKENDDPTKKMKIKI